MGDSCYPLSPLKIKFQNEDEKKEPSLSKKDQIISILKILGNPSEDDMSFISDDNALDYYEVIKNPNHITNRLDKIFKDANPEIRSLLKGLLEFNPHFRLTAKEALQSKVFDKIREPFFEKSCPI